MLHLIYVCGLCLHTGVHAYVLHRKCYMWIVTYACSKYAHLSNSTLIFNLAIYHNRFKSKVVLINITFNDYIIFYHFKVTT